MNRRMLPDRATTVAFLQRRFDDAALVASLAHLSVFGSPGFEELSERDTQVLAALGRADPQYAGASPEEVAAGLSAMDDAQLEGLVSNVKGVLHEMDFVRVENADGDTMYAALFAETNHPGTDVTLVDRATGETTEIQLKATDSASAVQDWLDKHPEGDILVTGELAERLDATERVDASGFSNEALTADVEGFVNRMISADEADTIWTYFPVLTTASIGLVVWSLWQRHQRGELAYERFKTLALRVTGLKLAKFAGLMALLSIPVVGQVTGAVLVGRFLWLARQELTAVPEERDITSSLLALR